MATVRHPFKGKPTLRWTTPTAGVHSAWVERGAQYRAGREYTVQENLAVIRPSFNDAVMLDERLGWVVARNSFDEVREFSSFDDAKAYVESLFALEYGS